MSSLGEWEPVLASSVILCSCISHNCQCRMFFDNCSPYESLKKQANIKFCKADFENLRLVPVEIQETDDNIYYRETQRNQEEQLL